MPRARKRYKPEIKARIIEAATAARAAGKPWKDAHVAAQQAGYKGNVDNLMKMIVRKAKKAAPAKKTAPSPAAPGIARNYDAATKAAIVKAALEARKEGKKWPEALVAAKAAGYRGGLISLMLFVKGAGKAARRPGRPAKAAPAPAKKRGRPAKAKAPAPVVTALDPVAAQYLVSAIDKAIAELQKLRKVYAM